MSNPYTEAKRQSQYQEQRASLQKQSMVASEAIPQFKLYDPSQESRFLANRRPNHNVKIVVVGDGGCGKTCLLVSYSQGHFPEHYVPTIFENYVTSVVGPDNDLIELALWDTAGQEEYDRLRPLSYPDVDVLLVCYSIDAHASLQNVREIWVPEVTHFCPDTPIILVGLKSDLQSGDLVPSERAADFSKEIGATAFVECSAKTMNNVNNVFNLALSIALDAQKTSAVSQIEEKRRNRISRVFQNDKKKKRSKCVVL